MTNLLREAEVLDWLLGEWRETGPSVCVLEGFSGIGKSIVAHKIRRAWDGPAVLVSASESDDIETLLLLIAAKLEADGVSIVADHPDGDFRAGLLELLATQALVVIDDFEAALDPESRLPRSAGLADLVRNLCKSNFQGRVLLVTSESPAEGPWLHGAATKTMFPPSADDARTILTRLMSDRGVLDEVPADMLDDVVAWLGNNPRAMEAFVACLVDEPLDGLIDLGSDAWQSRELAASPMVVRRLEERFLTKTIERLDAPSRMLLESLSAFRRSFTIDAIREMTPAGSSAEALKDGLASRFLLGRDRRWYSISPVARQLALSRLGRNERRRLVAHRQAAQHYRKRLQPRPAGGIGGGGTPRDLVRVGAEFVEARYHLLAVGAEADFQELAANYRRIILGSYQHLSRPPSDPAAVRELIATLGAALFDLPEGYGRLRGVLAALLAARGRPRDLEVAYRQATLATLEVRDLDPWLLRVELACRLDTPLAIAAVVEQGARRLPERDFGILVRKATEAHGSRRQLSEALKVVRFGLENVRDPEIRQHLLSLEAFVLSASGDREKAIDVLVDAIQEVGRASHLGWRLVEQALFLAHQQGDRERIVKIRQVATEGEMSDSAIALCDLVTDQIERRFARAAEKALDYTDYFALVCQGAFSALVAGEVERATFLFESGRFVANSASWWLRGLIALCQGSAEVYWESMAQALGRELSVNERSDPLLWLHVWAERPPWIGNYPAFYFPRLPALLTGLQEDIVFMDSYVPLQSMYPLSGVSLPVLRPTAKASADGVLEGRIAGGDRAPVITIIREMNVGDTFRVNRGVAVGGNGHIAGPVAGRDINWPGDADASQIVAELRLVADACEAGSVEASPVEVSKLRVALEAAEQGDPGATKKALSGLGSWSIGAATEVGASVLASAIAAAIGLG
ncbi:hypothetical protein ACQEVI_05885 [Promicromonospora sp. CA-289599]|uniref:hypothetical protein n=1 Tax=Promicromonospora sp. CA-289599 TaxID=3240014 RepID=UPI003D8F45C0